MQRRNFLKAILLGCAAPSVLLRASSDAFQWKRAATTDLYVPNPEWINAPYEVMFYVSGEELPKLLKQVIVERGKVPYNFDDLVFKGSQPVGGGPVRRVEEPYPMRFDHNLRTVCPIKKLTIPIR